MGELISSIKSAQIIAASLLSLVNLIICVMFSFIPAQGREASADSIQSTIYKGGTLTSDEIWTSGNVYVITNSNVIVSPGVTLTIEEDTIVKIYRGETDLNHYIDIQGKLILLGGEGHEVVFTSYRDDTYGGDTNGDGNNTIPAPGDWLGLYLRNDNTTFQYSILRYSKNGLAIWNDQPADIQPAIFFNAFEQNIHGISLFIRSVADINSHIENNVFTHNNFGIYTDADLTDQESCDHSASGTALPTIADNNFNNNSTLPIYLKGSAFPTYVGNTFLGYPPQEQRRLGIGLGCHFKYNGAWVIVNNASDGSGFNMPYVILENTTVDIGYTVSIPASSVIKFDLNKYLDILGTLNLQSSSNETLIKFTSIREDINGDTNGDGTDTEPKLGDWLGLYIENSLTPVHDVSVKFSENGLVVWNASTQVINPPILNSFFTNNNNGIQLHTESSGNITSLIQNNQIYDNHYGLITTQNILYTGTSLPTILDNDFSGNTGLPIYLAGSAFPIYTGNTFSGYPEADQRLGIGLSGYFNMSGTWPIVNAMPYVILGNTIVNSSNEVTLPENMIMKFDVNSYLDVKGSLLLQSDSSNPINFTSFKDDLGGDTNGDWGGFLPAPGDWDSIYLENPNTTFTYTTVKYAKSGLTPYNGTTETFDWTITNNAFSFNQTGLYYRSCGSGINMGILSENNISNTAGFPIILNGTAYPVYLNNDFSNNLHPAIAITGDWYGVGSWPDVLGDDSQIFPYVVIRAKKCDNLTDILGARITPSSDVSVMPGAVIKFDTGTWMDVQGTLTILSTALNKIVFTSYKDDTYKGDTNADGDTTLPGRGDYDAIYLESSATNFHDTVVNYSNHGVTVYNSGGLDINPPIQDSRFEENNYGIFLQTNGSGDITSDIVNNVITNNQYGLVTFTNAGDPPNPFIGGAFPTLSNNTIENSYEFPIFLNGTADPDYIDNYFANNAHPAIALGGFWNANVTWTKVIGDGNQIFPYVVLETITEDRGINPFDPVTITVPDSLIIKFNLNTYLYAYGSLDLKSTPTYPIIVTSFLDDSYAGDTNDDGNATQPGLSDWKTIWLIDAVDKTNDIHDIIAKHATAAIGVYYDGPENTQISTSIRDSTFSQNHVGVVLAIGWEDPNYCEPCQGRGNIISPITNVDFVDNLYGLVTYAHKKSTGYSAPTLNNVTFHNTIEYPIFLGGTSFPIFESANLISETRSYSNINPNSRLLSKPGYIPVGLDIDFIETPGIKAERAANADAARTNPASRLPSVQASGGLSIAEGLSPAIGLGGDFNNTGTLYQEDNLPYAVTGNFPLIISINEVEDPVDPNLYIGRTNPGGSMVTLLPNTVVKMGHGQYIIVLGNLNALGTLEQPVIFTSIKDDSVGGDTNRDSGSAFPAKGDWYTLALESSYTDFINNVVKYSSSGLYIYFNGDVNENINPMVSGSIFLENNAGMTLWTAGAGDILSEIHHNLFLNNDVDILGHLNVTEGGSPSTGRLMVNIHHNDLLGETSYGVNNLSTNWTIQAQNNYWGDASGPQHSTNPGGHGVPVSDRVNFSPWITSPSFPMTYSIEGRVVSTEEISEGIPGVAIQLSNGMMTETDAAGYYIFNGVNPGNYSVNAVLSGYKFTPTSYVVSVPPDATVPFIVGEVSTEPTFSISGHVRDLQNIPVDGVIITLDSGGSTLTDENGFYQISGLVAGTYVITPILDSFTFTPPSRQVTLGPDRTNQNFAINETIGSPKKVFLPITIR